MVGYILSLNLRDFEFKIRRNFSVKIEIFNRFKNVFGGTLYESTCIRELLDVETRTRQLCI